MIGNACDGDLDNNGIVNWQDKKIVDSKIGGNALSTEAGDADFNVDGKVDSLDVSYFWGKLFDKPLDSAGADRGL